MKKSQLFWLKLFNVRKDESGTVSWFFLHHFSLGVGLALLLTVSGTLFLSTFSVEYFPLVYVLSAVAMMLTGKAYSYFEHSVPFKRLLPLVLVSLVVLTILYRIALFIPNFYWLPVLLFIGFRVIYLLSNLEFWGLSALVFDVRQGKRLFGLISSGDVPAKLLGYLSVYLLVPYIGLPNLLVIAAISFAGSYYFLRKIFRNSEISILQPSHHHHNFPDKSFLQAYFGNRFILVLSVLSFFTTAAFTFVDYSLFSNVQARHNTQEELAAFLSIFFTIGYALTLVVKMLFSGRITYHLGIKWSLMLMPAVLGGFSLWYIFKGSTDNLLFNNLLFIGILSMATGVVKYSVNDPVFLAMFQPMQTQYRLKGHTLIKGFIQPIAIAFTGTIIWLLQETTGQVSFYNVNIGLIVLILSWFVAVVFAHRSYVSTLEEAIRKRFIAGSDIAIHDSSYYELLQKKLGSNRAEEVIYSIVTLEKTRPDILRGHMNQLLVQENEWILENAIPVTGRMNWEEFSEVLYRIFREHSSNKIRALAIETCCRLKSHNKHPEEELNSTSGIVQQALISSLVLHGEAGQRMAAEEKLLELVHSDNPIDQELACNVIERIGDVSYYKPLINFIASSHESVQLAAIRAAGSVKNDHLLEPLFGLLHNPQMKREVEVSLGNFGIAATEQIQIKLNEDNSNDEEFIIRMIRILERCADARAAEVMFTLANHSSVDIRSRALAALYYMDFECTKEATATLQSMLSEEFKMIYAILNGMDEQWMPVELRSALEFETVKGTRRIFNILGLLYDKEMLRKAEAALQVVSKEKKANALEILDHIIPRRIHDALCTLVENIPGHEKIERLKAYASPQKHSLPVLVITSGREWFTDWTIAMALRSTEIGDPSFIFTIQYLSSRNPVLRQCAFEALKSFREDHHAHFNTLMSTFKLNSDILMEKHTENRLSEIEKVLVLKSTALFAETPENIIAELVAIVKEEFVSKDELIFRKGDSGSSMYIIYEGEIRIHDGSRTFATLGSHDFFGELALLDPEPRSASATAATDTLLLKLEEDDAYELMEERTEVLKSIMRILCRRIRAQNVKLMAAKSGN